LGLALRRIVVAGSALAAVIVAAVGIDVLRTCNRPSTIENPTWCEVDQSIRDWDCTLPHLGRPLFLEQIEGMSGNARLLRIEVRTTEDARQLLDAIPTPLRSRVDGAKWPWIVFTKNTSPSGASWIVEIDARQPYN
jgi:hypothetical protein